MERDFGVHSEIAGGGGQSQYYSGVQAPAATTMGIDEAFLNGCFTELSFRSVLRSTFPSETSLNYYAPYNVGVSAVSHADSNKPVSLYGHLEQTFPASESTPPLNNRPFRHHDLRIPKNERFDSQEFAFQLLKLNNTTGSPPEPLINFFSTPHDVALVGVPNAYAGSLISPGSKLDESNKLALPTPSNQPGSLNDILSATHQPTVESSSSSCFNRVEPAKKCRNMPYSKPADKGKERRQRIGDKTRRLQRLLPWDKKMDTGTLLEEAYKYVKFLETQVKILQAMPLESGTSCTTEDSEAWGELGKLNRQQLLQVMVNSPGAQTLLYSRGCCVYSREQMGLLQKLAETKAFWEQRMFGFH